MRILLHFIPLPCTCTTVVYQLPGLYCTQYSSTCTTKEKSASFFSLSACVLEIHHVYRRAAVVDTEKEDVCITFITLRQFYVSIKYATWEPRICFDQGVLLHLLFSQFLCTRQETLSIGTLRARAFEAQTWVKVQLDNLGALPDEDSDRDLEAGWVSSYSSVLIPCLLPSFLMLVTCLPVLVFLACFFPEEWWARSTDIPMHRPGMYVVCYLVPGTILLPDSVQRTQTLCYLWSYSRCQRVTSHGGSWLSRSRVYCRAVS